MIYIYYNIFKKRRKTNLEYLCFFPFEYDKQEKTQWESIRKCIKCYTSIVAIDTSTAKFTLPILSYNVFQCKDFLWNSSFFNTKYNLPRL